MCSGTSQTGNPDLANRQNRPGLAVWSARVAGNNITNNEMRAVLRL
jgi:hypothetical protein